MTEAKEFFAENGYYHARSVFSPDELSAMTTDFDCIVDQIQASGAVVDATWDGAAAQKLMGESNTILHTHNVQQFSAVWLRAIQQERFLGLAQKILGENIVLHHTKLFLKPPRTGSPFPMHQDWSYFPTLKDTMIAAIIHVSDATDEMGCLRVYPESHRLGRMLNSDGRTENPELQKYPIENATRVEARAGDVVFFSYCTLHGSMPNRSDLPRKTVLVQMHAGDDRVEPGNFHANEALTLRGRNFHATRESAGQMKVLNTLSYQGGRPKES
ncbi:MAG: phytanoyl-CoA dioxygenase family protein [Gammaproteobacteria bacterium]|nr:MAG: phytanoyl-CoA dioxygenase family protein [Gammaproteobacteria bacterium]